MHRRRHNPRKKLYVFMLSALAIAAISVNVRLYLLNHSPGIPTDRPGDAQNDYVRVFTHIYETNEWAEGSGPGSDPKNASQYMAILQYYLNDPRFSSIVDIGCGDWQIMRHMHLPIDKQYIGYDVVESVIATNRTSYGRDNVRFIHTTGLEDLKALNVSGDLLIIKDVMQHWPNSEIQDFIQNILPRFKYALITNYYTPESAHNKDKKMGPVHSIGLLEAPFKLKQAKAILEYDGPDHKQVLFYDNANLS